MNPLVIPADIINSTIKNRYFIESILGQGGFGSVYKGRDRILEVPIAVKMLLDNSPPVVSQFHQEGKILARLKHSGLPRVTDCFSWDKKHFLVMDFIDGRDLQQISDQALPPVRTLVSWIIQVLCTLEYIHGNNIIHRDVKPGNIKISSDDKAYLVDFGISKIGKGSLTAPGARGAFTPHMAPPEQCQTLGSSSPESDIYSVGATLYYILTGEFPPDSISRLMGAPLKPVDKIKTGLSQELSRIILKAMELQPEKRYPGALEMAKELEVEINNYVNPDHNLSQIPGTAMQNITIPTGKTGFKRDIRLK
jgi:eukaryotic-like serine/threonine-protein kinase